MGNTVLDIFDFHVTNVPKKKAVIFEKQSLTYSQLNEKSNQLARFLLRHGILPETPVPILLSDPLEALIAILGILKACGAYVPIDTAFPAERISYLLEDTGAALIISSSKDFKLLALENTPKHIILVDEEDPNIRRESPENLPHLPSTHHLAYIIYTSGSTGRPKGVMIEHGSLVDYLKGLNEKIPLSACQSFALGGTMATDLGNTVVFGSLFVGGTLHVFTKEAFNDVSYILPYFEQHKIDCLKIVPSHWRSLSYAGRMLMPLQLLIFGGEALHREIIHEIYAMYPSPCVIVNHYGPTETTIGKLLHVIKKEATYPAVIPIGKPFGNNRVYLLDSDRRPVEQGAIGEIYISGRGVTRGYLNKADLSSERFFPAPLDHAFGRMYRTGDLGRLLPDGDIEFLGRQDDQVKINGYRIELGEVENTLKQYSGTKQCVVLARDDKTGNKRLVGYVVPKGSFNRQDTLAFLKHRLPSYMIPQLLISIDQIPFTLNGKINKEKLPNPDASSLLNNSFVAPSLEIEKQLSAIWKTVLGVTRVGTQDNFFELGGSSLLAVKTTALMNQQLNQQLPVIKLYQYPTIQELAAHLRGRNKISEQQSRVRRPASATAKDIAVIGLAGRFPGADSIDELWTLLKNGVESTHFFKDEELSPEIPGYHRNDPAYVKARGVINGAADFDAAFFGITPKLAELMDPQQRIFLEIAWEALEKSGHIPSKYGGLIGVYAGVRHNSYYANNVLTHRDLIEQAGRFMVVTVNDKDYVATRTAYSLDLKGPAVNVQSACSTSLLAIAQAVEGIRSGKCDVALAGGATITAPLNSGHIYEEGAMLSKDGHCRPFDADATGTVFSDGAGVVVLKDRELAEQDGDTVFAVIKGVGISNDGGYKGSFTAPSAEGQAAAIRMAIDDAAIEPQTITYIETHGTATPLGDPIEIEGLKLAFGAQPINQFCAIGSLKSNMGHLTCAAGVSGFIKAVLALHHQTLPPSINYSSPNPNIDFQNSPFIVNDRLRTWDCEGPRRAGISSFGVGGTNVHVVLEEYQNQPQPPVGQQPHVALISWSAKSEKALEAYAHKLRDFLINHPGISIHDIGHTLRTARADFNWRVSIAATDHSDLLTQLESGEWQKAYTKDTNPNIAFMFPGQGAQYIGMGHQLYQHEEVFRAAVDECAELLAMDIGEDIRTVIYADNQDPAAADKLKNTFYTQPALFITEYALAKLWINWGLVPTAFIGHSVGEFVAAHLAGVFSLADALKLVASRSRLISSLPAGSMLSVRAPYDKISSGMPTNISLAAINAPSLCVVAGETEAIASYTKQLEQEDIVSKPLHTSHAFHSHMMEPILEEFRTVINSIALNPPQQPIVSTVTGSWLTDDEATSPAYWVNHVRATVRFSPALQFLFSALEPALLEVGPGNVTATLAKQHGTPLAAKAIGGLDASTNGSQEYSSIFTSIGKLWQHNLSVNWDAIYPNSDFRRLTDLPTYAFDNKSYWIAPAIPTPVVNQEVKSDNLLLSHNNIKPDKPVMRKQTLINKLSDLLEDISGFEIRGTDPNTSFIEIGLDSLLLTQIALILKKEFNVPVTFRQLNEDYFTLDRLATYLDQQLPTETLQPETVQVTTAAQTSIPVPQQPIFNNVPVGSAIGSANTVAINLISQQLHLLSQQLMLLQGQSNFSQPAVSPIQPVSPVQNEQQTTPPQQAAVKPQPSIAPPVDEAPEVVKPFGAGARIEKQATALTAKQLEFVNQLTARYNAKTVKSKSYTQEHRAYMADPRVVSGFKPTTKELVYSVVVNQSKGSRIWDIDGNEYIDALNGFGSNMLGYQPDFIKQALIAQIEKGYEIGPQHELSGEVCKLICEFTKFDRAALCNTGSEAVLGAMRIARTVTGKPKVIAFSGSYHGITDEVIVRSNKKGKTFPAAPGIMAENVQNMIILDYNVDESLDIIRDRSDEVAAVLVEPIQSRHSELRPLEFLKKLRKLTEELGIVLIFDEVISGFRFHPGGIQGMYGIHADLGTYGKVAGGGISIGIIAGKKQYMDALDGGFWQYGDNSIPEVGVTYFAGTFVRHPLALATAKASLQYLKEQGPQLQETLNKKTEYIAHKLNSICQHLRVPLYIAQFGSLWRLKFKEEYPYSELFFTLMRLKGIHILEGFSCFLTTAHSDQDIETIIEKFEESLIELKAVDLIPDYEHSDRGNEITDPFAIPPLPNAKLGKDKSGNPAWFVMDEKNPGNYLQLS